MRKMPHDLILHSSGGKANQRTRKAFKFHETGKFQKLGQRLRAKVSHRLAPLIYELCIADLL